MTLQPIKEEKPFAAYNRLQCMDEGTVRTKGAGQNGRAKKEPREKGASKWARVSSPF